ncbi:MAG: hypothetical protein QMD06_05330 [Candidatus Altarchaeum sp.]|nr:hypothetical protein [Candidatus Altarchaeum sp.]
MYFVCYKVNFYIIKRKQNHSLGKDNVSMSAKGDGRIVLKGNNKDNKDNKDNKGDRCCCIDILHNFTNRVFLNF